MLRAGRDEGDLRDRRLPADEHRRPAGRLGERAADDGRLAPRGRGAGSIYALEGSAFVAGAAVQWLRDGLRAGRDAAEIAALADSVTDTGGRLPRARLRRAGGAVLGRLRPRDPRRPHPRHGPRRDLREPRSTRWPTRSPTSSMRWRADAGIALDVLRVDGGASANDRLCQFQADLLDIPSSGRSTLETTALGAAGWPAWQSGCGRARRRSPRRGRSTDGSSRRWTPAVASACSTAGTGRSSARWAGSSPAPEAGCPDRRCQPRRLAGSRPDFPTPVQARNEGLHSDDQTSRLGRDQST